MGTHAVIDAPTRSALLAHARAALEACARGEGRPAVPAALEGAALEHEGCFVTLRDPDGALRGCIGTFDGEGSLGRVVGDMAARAARHDPRFDPVRPEEAGGLDLHISVLTPRHQVGSAADIRLGEHGVELRHPRGRAVFLPQVAPEQGWSVEETLEALCRKARLAPGAWRDAEVQLWVFEAEDFGEGRHR